MLAIISSRSFRSIPLRCLSNAIRLNHDGKSTKWDTEALLKSKMSSKETETYYWKSFTARIKQAAQERDMVQVREFHKQLTENMPGNLRQILSHLLSACVRVEDIPLALDILQGMRARNLPVGEQELVVLIRCYALANNYEEAEKLVNSLPPHSVRLRTLQPIIDLLYRQKQAGRLIKLLGFMKGLGITPKGEQIALLLQLQAERLSGPSDSGNEDVSADVRSVLEQASVDLLGFEHKDIAQIAQIANQQTSEAFQEDGILVDKAATLQQAVIDDSQLSNTGYLTAWSEQYTIDSQLVMSSPTAVTKGDRYLPLGVRPRDLTFTEQRYAVKEALEAIRPVKPRRGRLVHIAADSCVCPNCNGKVSRFLLTDEEASAVREAIYTTAAQKAHGNVQHLHQLEHWLSDKHFDFIIDAANVAYSSQNFWSGKFNYAQVNMVVNRLQRMGKKVMIVLPSCYHPRDRRTIPNSITHKNDVVTDEDIAIVTEWERQDVLFVVPKNGSDDWFWMLASILPQMQRAYVITNDLMRDHKVSFITPKPFMRWRASQIVFHTMTYPEVPLDKVLMKAIQDAVASGKMKSSTSTEDTDELLIIRTADICHRTQQKDTTEETEASQVKRDVTLPANNIALYLPGTTPSALPQHCLMFHVGEHSREIQYSSELRRWHIPACDRKTWLCLDVDTSSSEQYPACEQ